MAHGSDDVARTRVALGTLVAVAVLVAGCTDTSSSPRADRHRPAVPRSTPATSTHHQSSHPAPSPTPDPPPAAAVARAELRRLTVRPRPVGTRGYERDAFGSDWVDTDHDGCNQRDDVLLRDAVPGSTKVGRQDACDHDVLAGIWHDPYTGRILRFTDLKDLSQAEAIQIDHVVPLAEAWVSGAAGWSDDRRRAFANDLHELLAVDGPTNASKSDSDPAAWRPRKGYQCTYAKHWIAIKSSWHLAVDPSEVAALRQMLGYCRCESVTR